MGESRSERSQHRNKLLALERLVASEKFQLWAKLRAAEIASKETVEEAVEKMMASKNIKIEIKDCSGKWIETTWTSSLAGV